MNDEEKRVLEEADDELANYISVSSDLFPTTIKSPTKTILTNVTSSLNALNTKISALRNAPVSTDAKFNTDRTNSIGTYKFHLNHLKLKLMEFLDVEAAIAQIKPDNKAAALMRKEAGTIVQRGIKDALVKLNEINNAALAALNPSTATATATAKTTAAATAAAAVATDRPETPPPPPPPTDDTKTTAPNDPITLFKTELAKAEKEYKAAMTESGEEIASNPAISAAYKRFGDKITDLRSKLSSSAVEPPNPASLLTELQTATRTFTNELNMAMFAVAPRPITTIKAQYAAAGETTRPPTPPTTDLTPEQEAKKNAALEEFGEELRASKIRANDPTVKLLDSLMEGARQRKRYDKINDKHLTDFVDASFSMKELNSRFARAIQIAALRYVSEHPTGSFLTKVDGIINDAETLLKNPPKNRDEFDALVTRLETSIREMDQANAKAGKGKGDPHLSDALKEIIKAAKAKANTYIPYVSPEEKARLAKEEREAAIAARTEAEKRYADAHAAAQKICTDNSQLTQKVGTPEKALADTLQTVVNDHSAAISQKTLNTESLLTLSRSLESATKTYEKSKKDSKLAESSDNKYSAAVTKFEGALRTLSTAPASAPIAAAKLTEAEERLFKAAEAACRTYENAVGELLTTHFSAEKAATAYRSHAAAISVFHEIFNNSKDYPNLANHPGIADLNTKMTAPVAGINALNSAMDAKRTEIEAKREIDAAAIRAIKTQPGDEEGEREKIRKIDALEAPPDLRQLSQLAEQSASQSVIIAGRISNQAIETLKSAPFSQSNVAAVNAAFQNYVKQIAEYRTRYPKNTRTIEGFEHALSVQAENIGAFAAAKAPAQTAAVTTTAPTITAASGKTEAKKASDALKSMVTDIPAPTPTVTTTIARPVTPPSSSITAAAVRPDAKKASAAMDTVTDKRLTLAEANLDALIAADKYADISNKDLIAFLKESKDMKDFNRRYGKAIGIIGNRYAAQYPNGVFAEEANSIFALAHPVAIAPANDRSDFDQLNEHLNNSVNVMGARNKNLGIFKSDKNLLNALSEVRSAAASQFYEIERAPIKKAEDEAFAALNKCQESLGNAVSGVLGTTIKPDKIGDTTAALKDATAKMTALRKLDPNNFVLEQFGHHLNNIDGLLAGQTAAKDSPIGKFIAQHKAAGAVLRGEEPAVTTAASATAAAATIRSSSATSIMAGLTAAAPTTAAANTKDSPRADIKAAGDKLLAESRAALQKLKDDAITLKSNTPTDEKLIDAINNASDVLSQGAPQFNELNKPPTPPATAAELQAAHKQLHEALKVHSPAYNEQLKFEQIKAKLGEYNTQYNNAHDGVDPKVMPLQKAAKFLLVEADAKSDATAIKNAVEVVQGAMKKTTADKDTSPEFVTAVTAIKDQLQAAIAKHTSPQAAATPTATATTVAPTPPPRPSS